MDVRGVAGGLDSGEALVAGRASVVGRRLVVVVVGAVVLGGGSDVSEVVVAVAVVVTAGSDEADWSPLPLHPANSRASAIHRETKCVATWESFSISGCRPGPEGCLGGLRFEPKAATRAAPTRKITPSASPTMSAAKVGAQPSPWSHRILTASTCASSGTKGADTATNRVTQRCLNPAVTTMSSHAAAATEIST
jgi:hypothetical protein